MFFSCVIFPRPSSVPTSHGTRHSLCLRTDTRRPHVPSFSQPPRHHQMSLSRPLCSSPPEGLSLDPVHSSAWFCSSVCWSTSARGFPRKGRWGVNAEACQRAQSPRTRGRWFDRRRCLRWKSPSLWMQRPRCPLASAMAAGRPDAALPTSSWHAACILPVSVASSFLVVKP